MSEDYDYFMQLDVSPYVGQWVGICNNQVVSHDPSFKEAYKQAKKVCGPKKPFISLVPTDQAMLL